MAPVPNPIPFEALHCWALRESLEGDAWERFSWLMMEMDAEYMAYVMSEQAKANKKG